MPANTSTIRVFIILFISKNSSAYIGYTVFKKKKKIVQGKAGHPNTLNKRFNPLTSKPNFILCTNMRRVYINKIN